MSDKLFNPESRFKHHIYKANQEIINAFAELKEDLLYIDCYDTYHHLVDTELYDTIKKAFEQNAKEAKEILNSTIDLC